MRTVSSSNAAFTAALSLSAYVEMIFKVFCKCVRRIGVNQIDAILDWRARLREITTIEPLDDRAAAKGISELVSPLVKQIVVGSSWEVRQVDFNSCSF